MGEAVDGILLLYHHPRGPSAPTIMEHVESWSRHSRFPTYTLNTELGFPKALAGMRFQAVVLHWSLFGSGQYMLGPAFLAYLKATQGTHYRVAFFQDEYYHCQQRFAFIDDYGVDCVYTLVDPKHWPDVYQKYTRVPRLEHTLTGFVSDELLAAARRFAKPTAERTIDIGYRGRELPAYMGRGAQEKARIAGGVRPKAEALGLRLDLATREGERLYGHFWHQFVGNCKAMLGVEAGVSIFDLEDEVRPAVEAYQAAHPEATFEEIHDAILVPWEDRIFYRTISPRHFEASAFRTCQILFEGQYNGILQAGVHYIPLAKDYANLDEVLATFQDDARREAIVAAAHRDLIESGRYTYQAFIAGFDGVLADAGVEPRGARAPRQDVVRRLWAGQQRAMLPIYAWEFVVRNRFLGRKQLVWLLKPTLRKIPALKPFLGA